MGADSTRMAGIILVGLSTVGFLLVGLGILGVPGLDAIWPTLGTISAVLSLGLLVVFWHPWLILGILIDLLMLVSVFLQWPLDLFNGG